MLSWLVLELEGWHLTCGPIAPPSSRNRGPDVGQAGSPELALLQEAVRGYSRDRGLLLEELRSPGGWGRGTVLGKTCVTLAVTARGRPEAHVGARLS